MRVTFLVDNNSIVGQYFLAEPGLSMLIETAEARVLFDVGYSDAFLTNSRRMGVDLLHLDWLVFSHGHFDHTWGLDALIRHYFEVRSQGMDVQRPKLLLHPSASLSKEHEDLQIGMMINPETLHHHFNLTSSDKPIWLDEKLVALGEIERQFDFEAGEPLGVRLEANGSVDDFLPDDTALAFVSEDGLVVISGCAHSGICNTVEHAKQVTGVQNVHAVLGGFHLLDATKERLDKTADYLGALNLDALYACHCTDLAAKIALARRCPVREVGSGLRVSFPLDRE